MDPLAAADTVTLGLLAGVRPIDVVYVHGQGERGARKRSREGFQASTPVARSGSISTSSISPFLRTGSSEFGVRPERVRSCQKQLSTEKETLAMWDLL